MLKEAKVKILFGFGSLILLSVICISMPALSEEIKLRSTGGVFTVPVRLNGHLTTEFIVDTGASEVQLPDGMTDKLISTGVMNANDIRGTEEYEIADGSLIKCRKMVFKTINVGTREVQNVKASSCPGKASLLLGQSFLKKLGQWSFDFDRGMLVMMSEPKKVKGAKENVEPPTYAKNDVEWYQNAGAQGDAVAQFNLAVIYEKGDGVPMDTTKAVEMLQKSAAQGYAPAEASLGYLYEMGERLPKSASKGFELYRRSAEQGFPPAQVMLAGMYRFGEGTPKNSVKALEWYQKATEHGEDTAYVNLGLMYEMGDGVLKNPAKAVEWYQKGTDQGGLLSQCYLGTEYLKGEGVPLDVAKGIRLLQKSAELGLAEAQSRLGRIFYSGNEVTKDKVLAWAWTQLAVTHGKANASEELEFIEKELTPAELSEAQKLVSDWKVGKALRRK